MQRRDDLFAAGSTRADRAARRAHEAPRAESIATWQHLDRHNTRGNRDRISKEKRSSRYRAIESFTRDIEGRDGSAMVDLVAHRLEDSVGQRMLQLEQARS